MGWFNPMTTRLSQRVNGWSTRGRVCADTWETLGALRVLQEKTVPGRREFEGEYIVPAETGELSIFLMLLYGCSWVTDGYRSTMINMVWKLKPQNMLFVVFEQLGCWLK